MNDAKEMIVRNNCFQVAGRIMSSLLINRRASKLDDEGIDELYKIATRMYYSGKKYWNSGYTPNENDRFEHRKKGLEEDKEFLENINKEIKD